jgi:predicted nucleotidyltransferase component of viral defense system
MTQLLKDIYTDAELANCLGFKGGTALMLFHELPRFSVDLDFNLLMPEKINSVHQKIRKIVLKYGKILDEAQKFFGSLVVLDYGFMERKLKIEISKRESDDQYDMLNLLGTNMKVMSLVDMCSHKLCALLGRKEIVNRDIFDCWFLLSKPTAVNKKIIEQTTGKQLSEYLQDCIDAIENLPEVSLLDGLGELVNNEMKTFIRNKLRFELLTLLRFYKEYPITD